MLEAVLMLRRRTQRVQTNLTKEYASNFTVGKSIYSLLKGQRAGLEVAPPHLPNFHERLLSWVLVKELSLRSRLRVWVSWLGFQIGWCPECRDPQNRKSSVSLQRT